MSDRRTDSTSSPVQRNTGGGSRDSTGHHDLRHHHDDDDDPQSEYQQDGGGGGDHPAVDNVGEIVRKMTAKKQLSVKISSETPAFNHAQHRRSTYGDRIRRMSTIAADRMRRMSNVLHDVPDEEVDEIESNWKTKMWKYRGYYYTLLSSVVHSLTALFAKWVEVYDATNITLWKCQGVLLPAVIWASIHYCGTQKQDGFDVERRKQSTTSASANWSRLKITAILVIRSILSINSLLLHFYSLHYLDLGIALVVSSTSPIFTYCFAFFLLGEPCGLMPFLTSLMTIMGVVVIIRPPIFSGSEEFDYKMLTGVGLALGCTLLGTLSFVFIRYLRRIHHSLIMFGYGAWGTVEALAISLLIGVFTFPIGGQHWLLAGVIAILSFFGQIGLILALKAEQSGPVSLVRTLDIIFGFLWQIIFWQILPDFYCLIGSAIIILGVIITGFRKWLASLPENDETRNRFWFILK